MITHRFEIIEPGFLMEDAELIFDGVHLTLTVISGTKDQTVKKQFKAFFVSEFRHTGIGKVGVYDSDCFNTVVVSETTPEEKSFAIFLDEFGKMELTARDFSVI